MSQKTPYGNVLCATTNGRWDWIMAEKVGFEPTIRCRIPDFESGAFDHSANSPRQSNYTVATAPLPKALVDVFVRVLDPARMRMLMVVQIVLQTVTLLDASKLPRCERHTPCQQE